MCALNQTVTVDTSMLKGKVGAPSSKSEAHRALICASFASEPTSIVCDTTNDDIDATIAALQALGTTIERQSELITVVPHTTCPRVTSIDVGESGSTLRFLLPVVAAKGIKAAIQLHGRLPKRPLDPLVSELNAHGVSISGVGTRTLSTKGVLTGGTFTLPGNISSQYTSGLLMAAPLLDEQCSIRIAEPVESMPYIDLTLKTLALFGVNVEASHITLEGMPYLELVIPANNQLISPQTVRIQGDWSNAAFWLSAAALNGSCIEVSKLDLNSTQGDRVIVDILQTLGARLHHTDTSVQAKTSMLAAATIDVSNCPDLVPPIAAVCALAHGTSTICGAKRLRLKESDRLVSIKEVLCALGAHCTIFDDGLVIQGKEQLRGGIVNSANDHRICMMAAILASQCTNPVTIQNASCINKSYPTFFEDLQQLGAHVTYKEQ